ncbi:hypothetical protein GCM10022220_08520 [Actinocatenispora rupis]|uniref:HD/PDEase domain-containing protein n=2 Tax=Actinocatenispora rupis TaxID=519421 RepID=A0A8J3J153_9ACTN|nr:hypothetical protein Aru02nite_10390 [Actinocatenispora rupis]
MSEKDVRPPIGGWPDRVGAPLPGSTVGVSGWYADPLWGTTIELTRVERDLLATPLLRRLHFVAHAGAARVATTQTYSRLEHTLGVFSLVAHWLPDATELRIAALLHDVGHLPLSHTLEGLAGLDHHTIGRERLGEVAGLLTRHGVNAAAVADVLTGATRSPLVGSVGQLSIDHLDSYVRSGRANGWLSVDPGTIRAGVRPTGGVLDTDLGTAAELVTLVRAEAYSHVSWDNVAPAAVLRRLAAVLLDEAGPGALSRLTDDELWLQLLAHPETAAETHRLRFAPHELTIRVVDADDPARNHSLRKIYRSAPLVDGQPLAEQAPELESTLAALDDLPRHFAVDWAT